MLILAGYLELSTYCTKLTTSVLVYAVQSLQPSHTSRHKTNEVNI